MIRERGRDADDENKGKGGGLPFSFSFFSLPTFYFKQDITLTKIDKDLTFTHLLS